MKLNGYKKVKRLWDWTDHSGIAEMDFKIIYGMSKRDYWKKALNEVPKTQSKIRRAKYRWKGGISKLKAAYI